MLTILSMKRNVITVDFKLAMKFHGIMIDLEMNLVQQFPRTVGKATINGEGGRLTMPTEFPSSAEMGTPSCFFAARIKYFRIP